jgi:hypothetical protein
MASANSLMKCRTIASEPRDDLGIVEDGKPGGIAIAGALL